MSFLKLAKEAEDRLRAARPADEETKEPQAPQANYRELRPDSDIARTLPFLAMSLNEFQSRGALLELRIPWLDVTLWMVPAERDVAALVAEGISRGRIWTVRELMNLMAVADRIPETVKTLTHAKLELDSEITEVRRR